MNMISNFEHFAAETRSESSDACLHKKGQGLSEKGVTPWFFKDCLGLLHVFPTIFWQNLIFYSEYPVDFQSTAVVEHSSTTYGGWKKSCTTLDGWNLINHGINHLSTGAGFLPSTVWHVFHLRRLIEQLAQLGQGRGVEFTNRNAPWIDDPVL